MFLRKHSIEALGVVSFLLLVASVSLGSSSRTCSCESLSLCSGTIDCDYSCSCCRQGAMVLGPASAVTLPSTA